MPRFLKLAFTLLLLMCVSPLASAQEPVAIVNGKTLTIEDLSLALSDLANQGVPQNELLKRAPSALRDLMVERLVEDAYLNGPVASVSGEETNVSLALRRADRARRRFLVDSYMRAKLAPHPVSQEEVDQYVRDNPDYFKSRKTYHFSELSIAAPSDTLKGRLNEELRDLAGQRNIRPQRMESLIDWLSANKFGYTHSKQWRGGEQVPRPFLDRLKELDGQAGRVKVTEANGLINVVVLYGAYEDPANPAHMRQSIVSQVLARQAREDQIRAIGDSLISAAKVQIFEKNFEEALKRPEVVGARPRTVTLTQKTSWALQFGVIVLGVFAGWSFFRRDHIAAGLTMHDTPGRHFSHSLEARLIVVGAFALFILASAFYVLTETNVAAFPTDATSAALVGISVASCLVLLIWKTPPLNRLVEKRWIVVGAVMLMQLIPVALN